MLGIMGVKMSKGMTVSEAARHFGVSKSTIYRRIRKNQLIARKVGRRWRIELDTPVGGVSSPQSQKETRKTMTPQKWPSYVHKNAEKDGLSPSDFRFDQWPVSNARISHPLWNLPDDIALSYHCEVPADTPYPNQYDDNGQKIPDPLGMALAWVKLKLEDASTGDKLHEKVSTFHINGKLVAYLSGAPLLWKRLTPGGPGVEVRLRAYPLFFYLDKPGSARLDYATSADGYFKGEEIVSAVYNIALDSEGAVLLNGEPAPSPPEFGPTEEEIREREESDRIMREEREAHERQEREIRERAARENREHNERMEREKREQEESNRKALKEAEAERKRNEKYLQQDPNPNEVRSDERIAIEDYFESQIKGSIGNDGLSDEDDRYLEFLRRVAGRGGKLQEEAQIIAQEKGWKL